jgi:hypothetical protein
VKKRLVLAGLGVMTILVGVAMFAANTAQWVNVTAHVEKEIELACVQLVDGEWVVDPNGCDFGVVFPQNQHEQDVELTLSNSFTNQDVKSGVQFHVLWECKQDETDWDEDGDTTECRYDLEDVIEYNEVHGKYMHPGYPAEGPLDGNLRDFVSIEAEDRCLNDLEEGEALGPFDKDILELGEGGISTSLPKCFYHLVLVPPACEGSFNPFTDPAPAPQTVECHEITDSADIQDWDRFVELGDNFKIQVVGFTLD